MSRRFSTLTRDAIRGLSPGERLTENGITVVKKQDGDVRYSVNVMVDGHRIHRVIGMESEGVTRSQCEDFIEAKRTEAREDRLSLPVGRKTRLTFSKAADAYIKRLEEDTEGKNTKAKSRQLKLYLKPHFADLRLDTLSTFAVDRYKKIRKETGASEGTVNRELATLSHVLNKAHEWGWIKAVPCKVKLHPESGGRITALTDEQCEALIQAAIEDEDPDCWLFVAFGLNTAMRHSEILKARFNQLDLDSLRLFIPIAKAGKREQPITVELADILRKERDMREDQEGWIFPSPRPNACKTGHRHRMDKAFRRAVIRAELDPETVTPHIMRHTAITRLVQAGVDLPTVQKISGHKSLSMVMRYAHVHGTHINEAIKVIGIGIAEQPKNKKKAKASKTRTQKERSA
jgi:integrase